MTPRYTYRAEVRRGAIPAESHPTSRQSSRKTAGYERGEFRPVALANGALLVRLAHEMHYREALTGMGLPAHNE